MSRWTSEQLNKHLSQKTAVSSPPNTAGGINVPATQRNAIDRAEIYIGIDCGVNTGVAVWNSVTKKFIVVKTMMIHQAFEIVKYWHGCNRVFVIVEDARQVKFKTSDVKAQGAGSVKRDAGIWEGFLKDHGIRCDFVRPNKAITKLTSDQFRASTGWEGSTNNHNRDAAMLVFGR
jgi:hypothetical protein